MSEHVLRWIVAFVVTQVVECPIYVRVFRVPLWSAFAASAITHPIVTWIVPIVWRALNVRFGMNLSPDLYFVGYGVVAEAFAIVAETLWLLRWLPLRRAALASAVANIASVSIGGLSYLVTGWP